MIFTILKKELKDTLRDRRTLMMMIIVPTLVFPIIMNIFVSISTNYQKESDSKKINVAIIGDKNDFIVKEIENLPAYKGKNKFVYFNDTIQMKKAFEDEKIDIAFLQNKDFEEVYKAKNNSAIIQMYYDASDVGLQERADTYAKLITEKAKINRMAEMQISNEKLNPIVFNTNNIASDKEMLGKLAGGMLPYFFIIFGFLGCMYPAIDLFTGEKERGTIETLLTTPVSRLQILIGKMSVVVFSGILASTCALIGLYFSVTMLDISSEASSFISKVVDGILTPQFIFMMYLLLFPLMVFFAGMMIPITIYAKTFKEAQSMVSPLNIIIVLPAMVGFFPGIELNWMTACIPITNVVLATKELIAGTLNNGMLALSFFVMVCLALISVFISYKRFDNEKNIVL